MKIYDIHPNMHELPPLSDTYAQPVYNEMDVLCAVETYLFLLRCHATGGGKLPDGERYLDYLRGRDILKSADLILTSNPVIERVPLSNILDVSELFGTRRYAYIALDANTPFGPRRN